MRNENGKLCLYSAETNSGWRVNRMVRFDEGERMVAKGTARREMDQVGNHVGYRMIAVKEARVDLDLASQPQPVSITAKQMEMNAHTIFKDGRSRTLGLPEGKRLERAARKDPSGHHLQPEDAIERTQRKVQVYKFLTGAKGDILRLWPHSAAEPVTA